jgi:RHS repeat-associated protein
LVKHQKGTADSLSYKFTGKERDSESGLDYFGARYYYNHAARMEASSPSQTVFSINYDFHLGSGNNGNLGHHQ